MPHWWLPDLNTLRPEQNGRYSAEDIFKYISLIEKFIYYQ